MTEEINGKFSRKKMIIVFILTALAFAAAWAC